MKSVTVQKSLATTLIFGGLLFGGSLPAAHADNYLVEPELAHCKPLFSINSRSQDPSCGRALLPKSYFFYHVKSGTMRVDLSLFKNNLSNGRMASADGRFIKYRDKPSHGGGYWKITTKSGQPLHAVGLEGEIKVYGKWGPYPYASEPSAY